jgi:hypothetical protein
MVNRYSCFFAFGVFLLGIGMALLSVAVWLRFHVEMPADDIASFIPSVKIGIVDGWRGISLDNWLAPHSNAHRIVVTRLLMLADYTFFGGKNYAIYLSTWVSIALLFVLYLRAFNSQVSGDRTGRYFIAGIALIFLCSPSQYYNLVQTISASWYVAAASSAISVWMLISAGKNLGFGRALLVILFAVIAAFSNFFGVLTCLVLPVVALYQRSRWWVVVLLFSIVFLSLYLQGIGSDASRASANPAFQQAIAAAIVKNPDILSGIAENSSKPWFGWLRKSGSVARSVCQQLGTPLSIKHPVIASLAVFGSVLLIFFYWLKLAIDWYLRREPAFRSVQFYLAMATICLGVSCSTWIGRVILVATQAERYQTIVMVYWLSISCLVYCWTLPVGNQRKALLAMFSAATIPLLFVWGTLDFSMPEVANFYNYAGKEQVMGRLDATPLREDITMPPEYNQLTRSNYEFLRNYAFRPLVRRTNNLPDAKYSGHFCDGIKVNAVATKWPGVQSVHLDLKSNVKPLLTRVELFGDNGGLGILQAKAPPSFQLRTIFMGFNQWDGFYQGDIKTSKPVILIFQSIFGEPTYCVL